MTMSLLGLSVTTTAVIGFVLLLIGVLSLFKVKFANAITNMFPGNRGLWIALFIIIGLILGGISGMGYAWDYARSSVTGLATGTATGVAIGQQQVPVSNQALACRFKQAPGATNAQVQGNISTASDPNDLSHYTISLTNGTNSGAGSFNFNLTCIRSGDVNNPLITNCAFKGGSYRNQVSTTDTALYYMVATTATKSLVPGVPWQQTAYIADNGAASTSSVQEMTSISFSGAQGGTPTIQRDIGVQFTLPGATIVSYLNSMNSIDDYVVCDLNGDGNPETAVARVTVTKVSN